MNANTTTSISLFNESRKRGLLLICISLIPIIFTSILFLLVAVISGIDFNVVGHESKFATIDSPQNRSLVNKKFNISGTVDVPLEKHSYFLVEYRNKLYWPKFDLGNKANSWTKNLTYRAKKNQYSTYQVIMADPNLKETIEDWFNKAKESGKYPGIKKLPIDHVVANIRVKSL